MASDEHLRIQVTIRKQEFPGLYQSLIAMTAKKQRANVLARQAYFGWLLEKNGVQLGGTSAPAPTPASGQLVEIGNETPISEWLGDLGGSDEVEEQAEPSAQD